MNLHSDLLVQARQLATRETKRPRQASLRRAISAAYYALFHLLIREASQLHVKDERLLRRITRVYPHKKLLNASKKFAQGNWPAIFNPVKQSFPIPAELKNVAQALADLQQARHEADYDLTRTFTRSGTLALIEQAEQAFADWGRVRKNDLARIYLSCFLLSEEWSQEW